MELRRCAVICIFDPQAPWILAEDAMVSRGRNTPFLGRPLQGRVNWTLLNGRVVFRRNREEP